MTLIITVHVLYIHSTAEHLIYYPKLFAHRRVNLFVSSCLCKSFLWPLPSYNGDKISQNWIILCTHCIALSIFIKEKLEYLDSSIFWICLVLAVIMALLCDKDRKVVFQLPAWTPKLVVYPRAWPTTWTPKVVVQPTTWTPKVVTSPPTSFTLFSLDTFFVFSYFVMFYIIA